MRRISVLGPITATRDGESVDLGGPTQRRLLATLIAAGGEVVPVMSLLDALWGEEPPPSGPTTIQSYVSRLRKTLGPDSIVTQAPGYRFGPTDIDIDADEFRHVAESLPDDLLQRAAVIRQLISMWSGPAYEDFDHLDAPARSLAEQRLTLEEDLAATLRQQREFRMSLDAADRVLAAEPLRESGWIQRALTLHASGRQAEAIKCLDDYRTRIGDIGLEASPALAEAENIVFTELLAPNVPLPIPPDPFVGRERELDALAESIQTNFITTVVGPGGMGKTRLALEALKQQVDGQPIWVVRLASISKGSSVVPAILDAIGVEARGDPLEALTHRLSTNTGTMLLDNCEHVIDEVATVVAALARTSQVTVVATSREALNTPGELVIRLDPMDTADAVDLFVERANRAGSQPAEDREAIADVCELVDYMPLAIEMAASRSAAMSPRQIADAIGAKLNILDRPLRGETERHQTLQSLVEWSYDLLSSDERAVFERLSVFSGAFEIGAATMVAGHGSIEAESVPAHVASLVERSLLFRLSDDRYRMLYVLKSFAQRRFEDEETRSRYAAYFGDLATAIGNGLSGPDELSWIDVAKQATDDLDTVIRWCADKYQFDVAAQILEGLFDWFYHRQPPAIVGWGDLILPIAAGEPAFQIASAWSALASMKRGDVEIATATALSGVEASDGPEARFPMFMTGDIACFTGDLELAMDMFDRQLVRASAVDDVVGVIDAVAGEALALSYQGMYGRALAVAEGIELTARSTGSPTYIAYADYTLGEALVGSDRDRAVSLFERAIKTARTVNNLFIEGMAHTAQGWAHMQAGEYEPAMESLQSGLAVYRKIGAASYTWTAIRYLALLAARLGKDLEATQLMSAAEAAGRRPYGSDEVEWLEVLKRVGEDSSYSDWVAVGASLAIEQAAELAAGLHWTTPLRR